MGGGGSKKKTAAEPPKNNKPTPKIEQQETPPEPKYGTYTPFTDFPTPSLLAQGQRDYTAANVEHKLDDRGIPLPFPPPTTRAEVFNPEDFQKIDEHARNTPLELGGKSLDELVAHLTSPARNDIGKVRAFFVWIANQGLQRLKAYEAKYGFPDENTPLFEVFVIVYKRLAGGYPHLLSKLCSAANIPCKVVQNDVVKAINYEVGDEEISGYNTHCLVYVDGAWRIIDQHWGSQGVIVKANADWEYLAGRKTNREEDQQVVYRCDDFYFLTDPDVHAFRHWVSSVEDQLLARPITKKEFLEMAYLSYRYHDLGFTSIDPPRCRVVAETGQVVIKLGLAPGKKYKFDYTLYKSKYLPDYNEVDGISLDRYVFVERKDDLIQITVNLRKYGKHKLVLHGAWEEDYYLNEFCEYRIDCRKPNAVCQPRPETNTRIWGMRFTADGCGLAQVDSSGGGVVVAEKGQAVLRFRRLTRKAMLYQHVVWSEEVKREDMRNNVRYYVTDDEVTVLVDLPKAGQYVYQLNGKDIAKKETLNLGSFIVQADRGVAEIYPYPHSDGPDQLVGDLVITADKFLLPESHPKPIIVWETTGEMEIRMKIVKAAQFSASLRFCSEAQQEMDCSEYLLTEMADGGLGLFMKFPKVGMYKLTMQANGQKIYQYLIHVKDVGADTLAYPKWNSSNPLDGFQLLEPRSRYLETDETVKFRVRVSKATSVTVSGEAGTPLKRVENTDIWEGTVVTGGEERDLYLHLQTDEESEPKLLLTYQVKSPNVLATMLADQEKCARRGREQGDRSRRKVEKEEREAEKRSKAMEDRKKKEDEFFEKNKSKFEKEEREFDAKEKEVKEKQRKVEEDKQFSSDKPGEGQTTKDELEEKSKEEDREAKKRLQEWQITYEEMRVKMARERLRQAAIAREPGELKAAIDECHSYGFNDEEIRAAEYLLLCLPAKIELKEACKEKDLERLEKAIQRVIDEDLEYPLESDLKEARSLLKKLKRMGKVKPLGMDRIAFAEIKTYSSPSAPLHKVMQAALLLVGENEERTQEWKHCQALVSSTGRNNLLGRIVSVEPKTLHREICARSKAILDTVNELELKRGAAVATFYAWAMGVIEEATEINDWKDDDVTPADVTRQRDIFHRDEPQLKQR